jgi:hypothetical protein
MAYKSRRRAEGFLGKIGSDEDGDNIDARKISHVTGAFAFQPPLKVHKIYLGTTRPTDISESWCWSIAYQI